MLCYQMAILRNKQVSGTKIAIEFLMVKSGISKNGINILTNMGMSSIYQTVYNVLKKNADNHKLSICTYTIIKQIAFVKNKIQILSIQQPLYDISNYYQ